MKLLIIGSGGREHAMAWKAAQSEWIDHVYVAPGNAGTTADWNITNLPIEATDIPALLQFADDEMIALTIVGPEAPLAAGIVDAFSEKNIPCLGPTQAAAQLESSKEFSKAFMQRHNIPTAHFESFTDINAAENHLKNSTYPLVVKADGLAAGKGVVIAQNAEEACAAANEMLTDNAFGEAGHRIIVEDFLVGEEASFIVISDGKNVVPLATSQDYKTRHEGNTGPNTGGMGACSPASVVTPQLSQRILEEVIAPTIQGMADEGHPYTGFLYAGIMISPNGDINVLEFNCRLGDPETQPLMMRLRSDFVSLCDAAVEGKLDAYSLEWDPRPALGVVMVADGYPAAYRKGDPLHGLDTANATPDCRVFHAGTAMKSDHVVTAGGRVLCVTALGDTIDDAREKAYSAAEQISGEGLSYRQDIGARKTSATSA